jgi:hypothetical protein
MPYYLYGLVLYIFVVIYEIRIKDEKICGFYCERNVGAKIMYKNRFMVERYLMCLVK